MKSWTSKILDDEVAIPWIPIHSQLISAFFADFAFPAQDEYSYFTDDFRLKISLFYSQIIACKFSVLECTGI